MERILKKVDKEKRDKGVQETPCQSCSCSEMHDSMKMLMGLTKKDLIKIIQYKNEVLVQYINWVDELRKK